MSNGIPHIEGFGRFREVGRGGFSTVYEAYQFEFGRRVAIKILNRRLVDNVSVAAFERECRSMGLLSKHPYIVTVLASAFTSDHHPCIVMDFFERGNYLTKINNEGPLSVEQLLSLGVCMAGALETAHRHAVIHGDVKPQNIFLSEFDHPALGDFGIAALRGQHSGKEVPLSIDYAAPEVMARGAVSVGPLADQYSLGATLYTLATGERVPRVSVSESPKQKKSRVPSEPASRLLDQLPRPLASALDTAMARNPHQRYPDLATFAAHLNHIERQLGYQPTKIPLAMADQVSSSPQTSVTSGQTTPDSPTILRSQTSVTSGQTTPESPTTIRLQTDTLQEPELRPTQRPRKRRFVAGMIAALTVTVLTVAFLLFRQDTTHQAQPSDTLQTTPTTSASASPTAEPASPTAEPAEPAEPASPTAEPAEPASPYR